MVSIELRSLGFRILGCLDDCVSQDRGGRDEGFRFRISGSGSILGQWFYNKLDDTRAFSNFGIRFSVGGLILTWVTLGLPCRPGIMGRAGERPGTCVHRAVNFWVVFDNLELSTFGLYLTT